MSVDSVNGQTGTVNLTASDIPDAVSKAALASPTGAELVGFIQQGTGTVPRTMLDKQRETVSVRDFGAEGMGADETLSIQAALSSGAKTVYANDQVYACSSVTVPSGVKFYATLKKTTAGGIFVKMGSSSSIVGSLEGTGATTNEIGVHPDGPGVNDVELDLSISNLSVGVQIWNGGGMGTIPLRWKGRISCFGLTGGGPNSNGYGLLISGANDCNFTVHTVNTPRHCVYLSNGSKRNDITLFSQGNGGAPVQFAAFNTEDYVENNHVLAFITGMVPTSTATPYGLNIVGRCRLNRAEVHIGDSAPAQGGVVFRANDSTTAPYKNYVIVFHKDGYAGPGVVRSDSGFENTVEVYGEGVPSAGIGTALISVGVYQSIIPEGDFDCVLRVAAVGWDAQGANMRGVAALASYAPVDIGSGGLRGIVNTPGVLVFLSGGGSVIGYTHRDIHKEIVNIPAGGSLEISRTFPKPFANVAYSNTRVICAAVTATTIPEFVGVKDYTTVTSVRVNNKNALSALDFTIQFDTVGY